MSIEFKINEDHTDEVLAALDRARQRALEMIGLQAEGYAIMKAPVDTGRLKNSISHVVFDKDAVAIGTNVEYAVYQEFGTSRMKRWKGPYLKPAVMEHLDEYKAIAESALKNA